MRGRKTDSEFLCQFISDCVKCGKSTNDDILLEAKTRISQIDEQIKQAEQLKAIRSKLVDVVLTFDKTTKQTSPEAKILPFFKIPNPNVCKFICDNVQKSATHIDSLWGSDDFSIPEVLFCIKQLLEHKIVSKTGDFLIRGEMFQEYMKFVLRS